MGNKQRLVVEYKLLNCEEYSCCGLDSCPRIATLCVAVIDSDPYNICSDAYCEACFGKLSCCILAVLRNVENTYINARERYDSLSSAVSALKGEVQERADTRTE